MENVLSPELISASMLFHKLILRYGCENVGIFLPKYFKNEISVTEEDTIEINKFISIVSKDFNLNGLFTIENISDLFNQHLQTPEYREQASVDALAIMASNPAMTSLVDYVGLDIGTVARDFISNCVPSE